MFTSNLLSPLPPNSLASLGMSGRSLQVRAHPPPSLSRYVQHCCVAMLACAVSGIRSYSVTGSTDAQSSRGWCGSLHGSSVCCERHNEDHTRRCNSRTPSPSSPTNASVWRQLPQPRALHRVFSAVQTREAMSKPTDTAAQVCRRRGTRSGKERSWNFPPLRRASRVSSSLPRTTTTTTSPRSTTTLTHDLASTSTRACVRDTLRCLVVRLHTFCVKFVLAAHACCNSSTATHRVFALAIDV